MKEGGDFTRLREKLVFTKFVSKFQLCTATGGVTMLGAPRGGALHVESS
jgi:hypothetical protein